MQSVVCRIIGAYIVPAYSSMGLVTVLYVFIKVSLFLPQWVEVRAFSILIVFSALSFEVLICSLNVSLGSKVSPSIFGLRIVGSRVLSSCSDTSYILLIWGEECCHCFTGIEGRLPLSKSVRLLSMVEVFVVLWYSFCRMSRW